MSFLNSEIVVLGILISMLFYEFTGISPAGLIVPAYLALYLKQPEKIVYTVLISFAAYFICAQLDKVMILYGRRRFSVLIVLSFLLSFAIGKTGLFGYGLSTIGHIIPGVMANEFGKQGVLKSLAGLSITVGLILLILMLSGEGLRL